MCGGHPLATRQKEVIVVSLWAEALVQLVNDCLDLCAAKAESTVEIVINELEDRLEQHTEDRL